MPQTEEHLGVLEVLGVTHGVVAISRCDRVDAHVTETTRGDVARRIGSSPIEWTAIVETSAVTGLGIEPLTDLLAVVSGTSPRRGDALSRPRLFVDRVFSMRGAGTVVTGTLDGAAVGRDESLIVFRSGEHTRVRDVQNHGASVLSVGAGSRCALNLASVSVGNIARGDALVRHDEWWPTLVFDGSFVTLAGSRALTRRHGYSLHIGTSENSAHVRPLRGDVIEPGESGTVRVRFHNRLPLTPGDRYLLRDPGTGTTVGGGVVLDVDPTERASRSAPTGTVESQLGRRGWLPIGDARRLTGIPLSPVVGDWFAVDDTVTSTLDALRTRVAAGSVDTSSLSEWEKLLVIDRLGVVVDHGTVGTGNGPDLVEEAIRSSGITPSHQHDRDRVRRLIQRGAVFEHDGVAFHRDVLDSLEETLRSLWSRHPEGFTVSVLRETLAITRKHAVPLAECLDKRGWTRRTGDVRHPGPLARGDR